MKATIVFEIDYPATAVADLARGVIEARNVLRRRFRNVRIVKAIDEASESHDTARQLAMAVAARIAVEASPVDADPGESE